MGIKNLWDLVSPYGDALPPLHAALCSDLASCVLCSAAANTAVAAVAAAAAADNSTVHIC